VNSGKKTGLALETLNKSNKPSHPSSVLLFAFFEIVNLSFMEFYMTKVALCLLYKKINKNYRGEKKHKAKRKMVTVKGDEGGHFKNTYKK